MDRTSKPWLIACSTNPNLSFNESDIERQHKGSRSEDFHGQFVSVVDATLERHVLENLPISSFKLSISFSDQTDCDGLVDKWFGILASVKRLSQVSVLVKGSARYCLSADTLFAMESLLQLELTMCKILKHKPLLLGDDQLKCRYITRLILRNVSVSESTLHSLISCCSPRITNISLQHCVGFSCICFSNLPNLLSLHILCCPIEQVHIVDAPKLQSFEYVNIDKLQRDLSSIHVYLLLNIGTCQNLRRVEFGKATIDDTVLFELVQKLEFIKELILHHCTYLKKINISSSTLEICNISNCENLVEVIFDVPKLFSLVFPEGYKLPSLCFKHISSQCRISVSTEWLNDQRVTDLRISLAKLNDQAVDLTLRGRSCCTRFFKSTSRIDHHLPPPQVDNLILSSYQEVRSENYPEHFDVFFWICRPNSLTVPCSQGFREILRKQLLKKRLWRCSKCAWKEYLINAEIDYKKKTGGHWVPLNRKMLRANPSIIEEIDTIRFTKNSK